MNAAVRWAGFIAPALNTTKGGGKNQEERLPRGKKQQNYTGSGLLCGRRSGQSRKGFSIGNFGVCKNWKLCQGAARTPPKMEALVKEKYGYFLGLCFLFLPVQRLDWEGKKPFLGLHPALPHPLRAIYSAGGNITLPLSTSTIQKRKEERKGKE